MAYRITSSGGVKLSSASHSRPQITGYAPLIFGKSGPAGYGTNAAVGPIRGRKMRHLEIRISRSQLKSKFIRPLVGPIVSNADKAKSGVEIQVCLLRNCL
jgi:hypothetical protein